jgi:hypothetical protein
MGIFAPPLRGCHKNGSRRSPESPAAIFTATALTESESAPFRRKEHLFSDSLVFPQNTKERRIVKFTKARMIFVTGMKKAF